MVVSAVPVGTVWAVSMMMRRRVAFMIRGRGALVLVRLHRGRVHRELVVARSSIMRAVVGTTAVVTERRLAVGWGMIAMLMIAMVRRRRRRRRRELVERRVGSLARRRRRDIVVIRRMGSVAIVERRTLSILRRRRERVLSVVRRVRRRVAGRTERRRRRREGSRVVARELVVAPVSVVRAFAIRVIPSMAVLVLVAGPVGEEAAVQTAGRVLDLGGEGAHDALHVVALLEHDEDRGRRGAPVMVVVAAEALADGHLLDVDEFHQLVDLVAQQLELVDLGLELVIRVGHLLGRAFMGWRAAIAWLGLDQGGGGSGAAQLEDDRRGGLAEGHGEVEILDGLAVQAVDGEAQQLGLRAGVGADAGEDPVGTEDSVLADGDDAGSGAIFFLLEVVTVDAELGRATDVLGFLDVEAEGQRVDIMFPRGDVQIDDGPRLIQTQRRSPRQRRRQQKGGSLGEAAHVGLGHQNSTLALESSNVTMCLRAEGGVGSGG